MGKHKQHLQDFDAIKKSLGHVDNRMLDEKAKREQHHASVAQRLEYLEKFVGDSADEHSKQLDEFGGHFRLFQNHMASEKSSREQCHASIEQRCVYRADT